MAENLWNETEAQQQPALDGLVYRSNLLGRDRAVANIYGGNTSAKLNETDHLGRAVEVLWVKGSGSDLKDITEAGFAGLRLAEILPLMDRAEMTDREMVDYLAHCLYALNRPRQSIETLLHAFIPARHVDHTHPDAIISLACAADGPALCRALWGERAIWIDYTRPGFDLSREIAQAGRDKPQAELVVMGKHGLVTWGESSRACYDQTIRVIQEAEAFLQERSEGRRFFTGAAVSPLPEAERRQVLARILPELRGLVSRQKAMILQVDDSQPVLDFVNSEGAGPLSQVGAACPDHLIHTKHRPLFVDWQPSEGPEALLTRLLDGVEIFVANYTAYCKRFGQTDDHLQDPHPRVILIPGLGMITTGSDAAAADVSRQNYRRAIQVMGGSRAVSRFTGLTGEEAFEVEYWPLEQYKRSLKPPPKELAGRIVIITGGASGIGRAAARRLAEDGAHVAILDINRAGAEQVAEELIEKHGFRRGMALHCDVTDEAAVHRAYAEVIRAYGGVDIVVSNAGFPISVPIEETTLADWQTMAGVLFKGYFLVSREAFCLWKAQKMGGNLIYVSSKNGLAANKNMAIYNSCKAAELQLARSLAEEGGEFGIRVNSVLPYAVLAGSSLWQPAVRRNRAATHGIAPEELEEYYRQRTTLKVSVYPEDVAEAISFLAGPRASRTTGGILTVDGGFSGAYVR